MLLYQQAFGSTFVLGIKLPDSFQDHSYKNDACPCFVHNLDDNRAIVLWVDFEEHVMREHPEKKRYTLELYIQGGFRYRILETEVPEVIAGRLKELSRA